MEVDSYQVANRVVVFGPVQPSDRDAAWIGVVAIAVRRRFPNERWRYVCSEAQEGATDKDDPAFRHALRSNPLRAVGRRELRCRSRCPLHSSRAKVSIPSIYIVVSIRSTYLVECQCLSTRKYGVTGKAISRELRKLREWAQLTSLKRPFA